MPHEAQALDIGGFLHVVGEGEEPVEHGGHHVGVGDAVLLDESERFGRRPAVHQDDPDARRRIEAVPLCGPKTADYLELIGIETFAELAAADARDLRLRVNAALGRPHINAMGVRAFENLIAAARAALTKP